MDKPVIGFIGFGEASYSISSGLVDEGVTGIKAYDVMTYDPKLGVNISKRAKELQVDLRDNLQSLIEGSDIIFCATSAKYAVPIAKEITPFLRENQIYVDINAASPTNNYGLWCPSLCSYRDDYNC
jgi:pyrroline-5-carboxylate reductase